MNRIIRLDPQVANQIAAGEVIERPANALKELVENALDAGARRIQIDIEEGGKKLMRVRDDGCGMNASDAVLCLQRHATSKLREADDLFAIRTLGFRGEAMPSIAAVSRLELTTREAEAEAGTRITVEAGIVTDVSEVAASPGTEIVIRDLFYNTPARFKFLKSDAAEAARIAEIVGHLALVNPHVAFVLRNNGHETLRVEAGGNAFNALVCVMGRDTARGMLPISAHQEAEGAPTTGSPVNVTGFAGRPQLTKSNRNGQVFYVNGRAIKNRSLQHAVQAAYEGLIHGRDRHPQCVVFIQLPPGAVDVNVHPTKSEVRFAREWEVHHAVRVALRETLVSAQLAPEWSLGAEGSGQSWASSPRVGPLNGGSGNGNGSLLNGSHTQHGLGPLTGPFGRRLEEGEAPLLHPNTSSAGALAPQQSPAGAPASDANGTVVMPSALRQVGWQPSTTSGNVDEFAPLNPALQGTAALYLPGLVEAEEAAPKKSLRALAQIQNNTYILCEGDDGLYIVCQHRAHERILADHAIADAMARPAQSQRLVIPFTVEAGPRAMAAVEENGGLITDLGFEVEAFGGASLLVRAVPANVANSDYEAAFSDLLDELVSTGRGGLSLQERRKKLLTMLSCKNAIKAGDPLQPEQMKKLLEDLMTLPNPSICPHGQPILIKISTLELDKKFEREYASR